jgi:hypothetical protein
MTVMTVVIGLVGLASAAAYLWRRQWVDAALALVAALGLALFSAGLTLPGEAGTTLAIDSSGPPGSLDGVRKLALKGDGLRAAQWHDLPALPLQWSAPAGETVRLDFPRQLALGRPFTLTMHRPGAAPARLQLLAENGQVIGEARGTGSLAVQWLPPLAERLVLNARLLDDGGKVLAEGPVPVVVREPAPLQVQGRFNAPSFDLRVLNQLLAGSGALLDWQVTLGKAISRSETARGEMDAPNLLVVDAAWFERASAPARASLLGRVAEGTPLLVLGANASEPGTWARALQLDLRPQPTDKMMGGTLAMASAPLNPAAGSSGQWTGAQDVPVWTRNWHKGRIGWLGAGDWHRFAITEPQALALWWQAVLDRIGIERKEEVEWVDPPEMPLPGQRLEVCARGVAGEAVFPGLKQTRTWQRRPDRADASCVAVWPAQPGWLQVQAKGQGGKAVAADVYVYAAGDWPLWQAAERRDATARYAARTPAAAQGAAGVPLPAWPFALLFAAAMLLLWWRERR